MGIITTMDITTIMDIITTMDIIIIMDITMAKSANSFARFLCRQFLSGVSVCISVNYTLYIYT